MLPIKYSHNLCRDAFSSTAQLCLITDSENEAKLLDLWLFTLVLFSCSLVSVNWWRLYAIKVHIRLDYFRSSIQNLYVVNILKRSSSILYKCTNIFFFILDTSGGDTRQGKGFGWPWTTRTCQFRCLERPTRTLYHWLWIPQVRETSNVLMFSVIICGIPLCKYLFQRQKKFCSCWSKTLKKSTHSLYLSQKKKPQKPFFFITQTL